MIINQVLNNEFKAPVRIVKARVEVLEASTPIATYTQEDNLISFNIERVPERNKFFGITFCQKLKVKLIDMERSINLTTANSLKVSVSAGEEDNDFVSIGIFDITEVNRDENNNQLSITAYDILEKAKTHYVADLVFPSVTEEEPTLSYTLGEFAEACASILGYNLTILGIAETETCFDTLYAEGANFDGTESIREAISAIAEATQTIAYVDANKTLYFRRLNRDGEADYTIDKDNYIDLHSSTNRRLGAICSATELGDNVIAESTQSGTTQYVRDNPFWDMREDIADLVENALSAVGDMTINQFSCSWRGNPLLQLGDKITIISKDNKALTAYVLNDTLSFNGALSQQTEWSYEDDEESADNPTTLGDVIKQTYAKVDKANKVVEIVASENAENSEKIGRLEVNTDNINASISQVQQDVKEQIEAVNSDVATLSSRVDATLSAEDVRIMISSEITSGANKITTSTGYTFDEDGLTVSKSGSQMKTQITEDGMIVFKNDEAVLTANNTGVDATNLHATTYLIIGRNSRFEDFSGNRTGCFWIGG